MEKRYFVWHWISSCRVAAETTKDTMGIGKKKNKLNNNNNLKKRVWLFRQLSITGWGRWQHPELRTRQPNLYRWWWGGNLLLLAGCHMYLLQRERTRTSGQDACSVFQFLKFSRRVPRISTINLLSSWWALDVVASISLLYILPHEWTKWEKI